MIKTQVFRQSKFSSRLLFRFLFGLNLQRPPTWLASRSWSFRLAESLAKLRPLFATNIVDGNRFVRPSPASRRASPGRERVMTMVKLAMAAAGDLRIARSATRHARRPPPSLPT
jgi:hypothetical protein